MLTLQELARLEDRLLAALAAGAKRSKCATLVEAIDDAGLWPAPFAALQPLAPSIAFERAMQVAPTVVCAVAAETGFRFQGVGTVFWGAFDAAFGVATSSHEHQMVGRAFKTLADRFDTCRPIESAFSQHFSIMAWPLVNALLPVDLAAPVARMLARGPAQALPARGRAPNLEALRAWATAVEGARLTYWLRHEEPAVRVLVALLTDNRDATLPARSFERLEASVRAQPETHAALRSAKARRPGAKGRSQSAEGRLSISMRGGRAEFFVTWPPLAPVLFDEARATARAVGWRPRLWGSGPLLHPDAALGAGPLRVAVEGPPREGQHAYGDVDAVFGAAGDVGSALAARVVDWGRCLVFDPDPERTQAEQRFGPIAEGDGRVWLAVSAEGPALAGLQKVGSACGYRILEADLRSDHARRLLVDAELLDEQPGLSVARHPIDAMTAPRRTASPSRPILVFDGRSGAEATGDVRTLAAGSHTLSLPGTRGDVVVDVGAQPRKVTQAVEIEVLERDTAFDALMARRLQVRVESRLCLTDVPLRIELDVDGDCVAFGSESLATVPATLTGSSACLSPIYADAVRDRLLARGRGVLTLSVGRSARVAVELERPSSSVEWSGTSPTVVGDVLERRLVSAPATRPHWFEETASIVRPERGASASGVVLDDGRVARPLLVQTSSSFDLGDLTARFGDDAGSRLLFDGRRGVADLARARVAWASGRCDTLAAVAARTRVVAQFEGVLALALCGPEWRRREEAGAKWADDPHEALWQVALSRGLASLPEGTTPADARVLSLAFAARLRRLDPDWPTFGVDPVEGAMDDALNAAFEDAFATLHAAGSLVGHEAEDFDFGSPSEDWLSASAEAMDRVGRADLTALLAPTEGARALRLRSYVGVTIPDLADDLAAWTRRFALPRGRLTSEAAVHALQLWLSPGACGDPDDAVRVAVRDPFVARALRYAAIRLAPFLC